MRKIICLLIIHCFISSVSAEVFPVVNAQKQTLYYRTLSGNTVSLCSNGREHYSYNEIIVPDRVMYKGKKYTVTEIEEFTFFENGGVTEIILPGTLKIIRRDAFAQSGLAKVNIPNSVTTIEESAFSHSELTSIRLPNSLVSIGKEAFTFCDKLESIVIPDNVKEIGGGCFRGCKNLKNITLPNEITSLNASISGRACYGFLEECKSLKTLVIPESVEKIGEQAFAESGLEHIVIPDNVKEMGGGCFYKCVNLKNVTLPNTIVALDPSTTETPRCDGFFAECESLETITIPNSVRTIGKNAFCKCKRLTAITIPSSVTKIGEEAFIYCESLNSVRGLTSNITYDTRSYYSDITHTTGYIDPFSLTPIKLDDIKMKFSFFALPQISKELQEWQKKGGFETDEQWRERVTEENRLQKIGQLIQRAKKEYIAKSFSRFPGAVLENYASEYNACVVSFGKFGKQYVPIPLDEVEKLRKKWQKVEVQLSTDVINDDIAITQVSLKMGKKVYASLPRRASGISDLVANLAAEIDIHLDQKSDLASAANAHPLVIDHSIDMNIPQSDINNPKTFVVIIGNENYQRVAKVSYALNDAKVFADYCHKTLGIPKNNIRSYKDATYGAMLTALKNIRSIANAYNGDISVLFYYAGHGIPGEANKDAYLLPVDADGLQLEICLATSRLYQELEALHARSVVVFMDACFSGSQRGDGMLASARGVALKVKNDIPQGNMVVFSAATGAQTAYPFHEKGHGMFTYFLLKKLQETKGGATLGEIGSYVSEQVAQQSVVVNGKSQTPTVISSVNMGEGWKSMKLNR